MKIKTKLAVSFCMIIFIPIILAGMAMTAFTTLQTKAIEEAYGITNADSYSMINTVKLLNRYTESEYKQLAEQIKLDPDVLMEADFQQELASDLDEKSSYLLILRNEEIVYNSGLKNQELLDRIHRLEPFDDTGDVSTYVDSVEDLLIKHIDFLYSDKALGSACIITSTEVLVPEVKSFLAEALVSIIVILLVTAGMLSIWIYQSMITPIRRLQIAAENIKEGNLDFELKVAGEDEIAELCIRFEEMRKRLKDNAEEKIRSEKESRALISNIAHDLKTPITAVKGYSEGILDGVANTPEKVDKYVRTIYSKANEMDMLINELTLYSKIDTNRIPYNFAKINVSSYFADCVEEIGLDLEAKGIDLTYLNYVAEDVLIIADPEQLRRVINNIIGNSVKYMNNAHGRINIRIKDVGDFIQVELEDNGIGIAQKDLPYIFDRFYRADASRNSATGGSGIGLSIVKKIMEDHGGKIWATSKENTGTTICFVIRKYEEVINE